MASRPITSQQIDGETMETVTDFTVLVSKITAEGDCSPPGPSFHGIFQARVLEWGAIAFSDDQPRQHIKKQGHYFANKGLSSQRYDFSFSHVWM